jgi:hypothetical protein
MNDCQYFSQRSNGLEFSVEQAFQPDCQPAIRAWLTDAKTALTRKEAFLQALLDFYDDCGGFYRVRSFLLAAEYLAFCPECRQGDLIIDRLLKLSYGYFRVEKADWCMPPEAFARSTREALMRTDLGRVVPRFEAVIRQTESRGVMGHAARELLRIQPGNRCGIVAIGFEHLRPEASQENTSQKGKKIIQPLWDNALRALANQASESDEVSDVAIHTLSLTCKDIEQYKLAEISEIYPTLNRLIQLAPDHPVVLPALLELMERVDSISSYCPTEANQWTIPIEILCNLVRQGDPACVDRLIRQLDDWEEAGGTDAQYYRIFKALGKLGHQHQVSAQRVLYFLKNSTASTSGLTDYNRLIAVEALGNIRISSQDTISVLVNLFENTFTLSDKYTIAVALRKLDKHQVDASAFIIGTINRRCATLSRHHRPARQIEASPFLAYG